MSHQVARDILDRPERPLPCELRQQTRLGQQGDVGRATALHAGVERGRDVAGLVGEGDLGSGPLLEALEHLGELVALLALPHAGHHHALALQPVLAAFGACSFVRRVAAVICERGHRHDPAVGDERWLDAECPDRDRSQRGDAEEQAAAGPCDPRRPSPPVCGPRLPGCGHPLEDPLGQLCGWPRGDAKLGLDRGDGPRQTGTSPAPLQMVFYLGGELALENGGPAFVVAHGQLLSLGGSSSSSPSRSFSCWQAAW